MRPLLNDEWWIICVQQRRPVELRWTMQQRNWADQERDISATVSEEDGCSGEGIERDENSCHISKHYEDNRFSEGRAPVDLPEAKANGRREEIAIEIPGLQPLVSSWCSWYMEWDSICRTVIETAKKNIKRHKEKKVSTYVYWVKFISYQRFKRLVFLFFLNFFWNHIEKDQTTKSWYEFFLFYNNQWE